MNAVDPTARVAKGAVLGKDVSVGPYCVIGPHVTIDDSVRLVAHVHVTGHTSIGARTIIYPFASLGTPPQSIRYKGGPTRLVIGTDCDIRESVTMNIGTEEDRGVTEVGNRCFFMVGSHVAHDCEVGDGVTFANNVVLGGHVSVGDNVVFGGQAAVRQHVRIGEGAMIVGLSGVRADIIPWGLAQGPLADLIGINVVGLRRRDIPKADIHTLRQAYQSMFFGAGTFRERFEGMAKSLGHHPLVAKIVEFVRAGTRPLTTAVHRSGGETL